MKFRHIALVALAIIIFLFSPLAHAVGNFSVGAGPVGNIYVVDGNPDLTPGVGGYLYFDYRWSPQFSTQFGVLVTTQDGRNRNNNDDGIEFLGLPTFDLKFFILSSESRWDPYALIGIAAYAVSEGTRPNGTTAVGIGANGGLGVDYYVTEHLSVGLGAVYRSAALIDSTAESNNGTAVFPFSLMGNLAWHW